MKTFLRVTLMLSNYSDWVAGTALVSIMLLTSMDVIGRYLGYPILGAYDLVSIGGAFIIGFAVPKSSWDKTHVSLDMLIDKIPHKKRVFEITTRLMGVFFFFILGWNLAKMGMRYFKTGDGTLTLSIPLYPLAFVLALCAFLECIVLLADMVRRASEGGPNE